MLKMSRFIDKEKMELIEVTNKLQVVLGNTNPVIQVLRNTINELGRRQDKIQEQKEYIEEKQDVIEEAETIAVFGDKSKVNGEINFKLFTDVVKLSENLSYFPERYRQVNPVIDKLIECGRLIETSEGKLQVNPQYVDMFRLGRITNNKNKPVAQKRVVVTLWVSSKGIEYLRDIISTDNIFRKNYLSK